MPSYYQIKHETRILCHQIGMSCRSMARNRKVMFSSVLGMLANNILFFMLWVLIFRWVPHLKGWELPDVAMMYGLGATCFGLANALFGGFRMIVADIENGKFDSYLGKPASPFILAITSATTPHGWGDALTGPLFWILFCHPTWVQMGLLYICALSGAIICTGIGVMIYSLGFWLGNIRNQADVLLYWTISFLTTPLHGMPYWIKCILFTVLPIGYVSYLPVEMIRAPSIWLFGAILVGAIWSVVLARCVFYLGLRQYKGVSTIRTGG